MTFSEDAASEDTLSGDTAWYFDGYNVLHAVLLGRERDVSWWRRDYQQRVVTRVEAWMCARKCPAEVTVVFDSHRSPSDSERVQSRHLNVVYAPSADEWLIDVCAASGQAESRFVTADRSLRDRLKARGARVVKPWDIFPPIGQE